LWKRASLVRSPTVLTSSEAGAAHLNEGGVEKLVSAPAEGPQAARALDHIRQLFSGLQDGKTQRSWLTDDANAYFTTEVIADFASSLKPFGTPTVFTQTGKSERGGMTYRSFSIRFGEKSLTLSTFFTPESALPTGP